VQVEPVPYLEKPTGFCQVNDLGAEQHWYEQAIAALNHE
jgi:hypothetical protein